jgi:hypothetical protein
MHNINQTMAAAYRWRLEQYLQPHNTYSHTRSVADRLQYKLHVNASISDNGRINMKLWTSEIWW